jgi:hypothetical protein
MRQPDPPMSRRYLLERARKFRALRDQSMSRARENRNCGDLWGVKVEVLWSRDYHHQALELERLAAGYWNGR